MSKFQEIKDRFSPVDSAVRADIPLLLKALELACDYIGELDFDRLSSSIAGGVSRDPLIQIKPDYWLELAEKEE